MSRCPLTKREIDEPFLIRENVPANQNKLFARKEEARGMPRGRLELFVCPDTGFIWNGAFDPAIVDYGSLYENTQSVSGVFEEYLHELCRHLVEEDHVRNCHIIEVGCGKGGFLKQLVEYPGAGNTGTGYDTSYTGPLDACGGRLKFHRTYYDRSQAGVPADVIICRHVIEHIHNPVEFLRELYATVKAQPHVRLFFETPTVEWILRNQVLYDFFYEHCSYFTPASLTTAFTMAGFQVDDVRLVFDGQYQWLSASVPAGTVSLREDAGSCTALAEEFAAAEEAFRRDAGERLKELVAGHTVAVWGAGAKGVTFCNLLDPRGELIDCVADLNPQKQGKYLPGTGHPIITPNALKERGIDVAIGMNPNYHNENIRIIRDANLGVELLYLCPPFPPDYEAHHRY